MTCRYITPADSSQQVHMGRQLAPGTFVDDAHEDVKDSDHTRLCMHADPVGGGPCLSRVVSKEFKTVPAPASSAGVVGSSAAAPVRRAKRSTRGGK